MAMALLCRRKGFFRYQLCGRLFSSSAATNPSPTAPFSSSSSFLAPGCTNPSPTAPFSSPSSLLAPVVQPMTAASFLRVSERRFSAEATSYPTPPPSGNFDDFPEAGDDYDEDGGEEEDPPPDPEEDALYSPSESEN